MVHFIWYIVLNLQNIFNEQIITQEVDAKQEIKQLSGRPNYIIIYCQWSQTCRRIKQIKTTLQTQLEQLYMNLYQSRVAYDILALQMIQNEYKDQKPQEFAQLQNRSQTLLPLIEQLSDKFSDYQEQFQQYEHINWKEYIKTVQQQQISINFEKFSPFQIKILASSLSYQITQVEIKWGYYSIKIAILNSNRVSCFHCCRFASGSYGKVYFYDSQQAQSFVVKCNLIDRQTPEGIYQSKLSAFKQYFITKIASAFGCGPYVKKHIGFDIIFSQNCIQFAMQQCYKPNKFNSTSIQHLKQHLFNLHQGGIIHFDIKPQNIMWSNHFKKQIIIDYGLSQINNGKIGYKQYVYFKGSLEYCSKQMSVLFQSKLSDAIDIHYNDVFSLKQSIKWLRNSNNKDVRQQQNIFYQDSQDQYPMIHGQRINIDLINRYSIILLKYSIYRQDHSQILNIYNSSEDKANIFEGQILNFIKEEYSSNFLFDFFKRYVSSDINGSVQFGWLEQWSKSIFSQFNFDQQHISANKHLYQSYYQNLSIVDKIQPENLNYLNLSELQALLFTQSITDQQYYFYVFVAYISFTNNVHRIGIEKKIIASQHFIYKIISTVPINHMGQSQSSLDLLFSSLGRVFHYILQFYIKSQEISSNSMKILQRLDLCLQIIEQSILICLMSTEQLLTLIEQFYSAPIWRQQDRLQIIFRIKYYITWNKFPLIPQRMYDHLRLIEWFEKKSAILMNQQHQTFLSQLWQLQSEIFQKIQWSADENNEIFQPFTKTLKLYCWLHRIKQSIRGDPHLLFSALQTLEKIIPRRMKSKIFPFYNDLIALTLQFTKNTQQTWKLCNKIKANIISKQMLKNYIPLLTLKCIQAQDKTKMTECLTLLFTILSPTNYFHFSFIIDSLIKQVLKRCSIKQTRKYINTHESHQRMITVIQQAINRFHFKDNVYSKFHGSGYCQYNYFTLRFTLQIKFGVQYSRIQEQLKQLQENNRLQVCNYCHFRKRFVILLLRKRQIQNEDSCTFLQEFIDNHKQLLEHFQSPSSQIYNRIELLNYKISIYSQFIKTLSFKDILHFPQFKSAIIELYLLLKTQQKMSYYIYMAQQNKGLIVLTLNRILTEYGVDEVIQFILKIVSAQKYLEATQYIFCISNNFRAFNQLLFMSNIFLVFLILQQLQKFQQQQPYIMLYYFGFVQSTNLLSSMKKYMYKTLKLLLYLPAKMCLFMTVLLFDFILHQQPTLIPFISVFNDNREELNRKLDRKTNSLKTKLTKLSFYFRGVEVEPKKNRAKCKKRIKLYEKCNAVKNIRIWIPREIVLALKPKSKTKRQKHNIK